MLSFSILSVVVILFAYIAEKKQSKLCFAFCVIFLVFYSGCRASSVGIDTERYYDFFYNILQGRTVYGIELGYVKICELIQLFFKKAEWLIFIMSLLTNALILWRLWSFREKCSFTLMCAIYIAGFYPETMNVSRQFVAVAMIFAGSYFLERNRPLMFVPIIIFAMCWHTSAILGCFLIGLYAMKNRKEHPYVFAFVVSALVVVLGIFIPELYDIWTRYSRYFNRPQENVGLILVYKLLCLLLIGYMCRFGFVRKDGKILGCEMLDAAHVITYFFGIFLCSLGMFFKYVDRVSLYFMMFEMPFWGRLAYSKYYPLFYKMLSSVFVLYLFIMNLIQDGQKIFPYTTIFFR